MLIPARIEPGRIREGRWGSEPGDNFGAFDIAGPCGMVLRILATPGWPDAEIPDGEKWEHVSVSGRRLPNWDEMCFVRRLFWGEEGWVVQFHPPEDEYVNHHPRCLHLWRYKGSFPTPPSILVGPKNGGANGR